MVWYKSYLQKKHIKPELQIRSILIVMMNITFNLNVAARFFIVIYARDFVKNGQVGLKY